MQFDRDYQPIEDAPHDGSIVIGLIDGEEIEMHWLEVRY